jgi:hypothetical protein
MLFVRFMFCLGVGLVGLSMVLMTVLETVFAEWDVAGDLDRFVRSRHNVLARYLSNPDENVGHEYGARLNAYGRPTRTEERAAPKAESEQEPEPAEPVAA